MGEAFQTLMFVKVQQSRAEIISVGPYSNIDRIICMVTGLTVSFSPVDLDLITMCRTISVDQPSIGDHCSNGRKKW
jgi:hypothetical protein